MVSTSKQMAALVRNLPVPLLQRLALSVTITLSIVRLGERKYRWMNSASYQVRSRRHQHRYLKVHLQHYHPPPKNQSDLSDQPVGKRSHVLLIPQHRSRNTDMQTYRPSTLRDHPLTSNHHSKYPTTMKTQALGAASALSCDYDDFESFARSLHCPMFSLFTSHLLFLIHVCTYVILIPLLAASFRFLCMSGVPPFSAYLTTQDNWNVIPLVYFLLRIVIPLPCRRTHLSFFSCRSFTLCIMDLWLVFTLKLF
jgi:hypothetical protein